MGRGKHLKNLPVSLFRLFVGWIHGTVGNPVSDT